MMSTRRSLFVFGALLAVGVLLAPQSAFAQPTSVTATATDTTITVKWTPDADTTANSHEVSWAKQTTAAAFVNNPANIVKGLASNATEYTITGLTPATSYRVGVRHQSDGNTDEGWAYPAAEALTVTDATPAKPAKPTGPEVTEDDDGVVTVSWETVTGATDYMVQYKA